MTIWANVRDHQTDTSALLGVGTGLQAELGAKFTQRRRKPRAEWLSLESLEGRAMMAASPLGPETQVNPVSTIHEGTPAIAAAANGDFVVVYESRPSTATSGALFARLYHADGTPKSDAFLINPTVDASTDAPDVAADAAGDFVVTWTDSGGNASDIYARLFSADGAPVTDEFRVNDFTTGGQRNASVGMDSDGDFVVAWTQANEVDFQLFNRNGTPTGNHSKASDASAGGGANSADTFFFDDVSVGMDEDGDFVVGWAETKTSLVSTKFTSSYTYPLYDDDGNPTGKTKTVTEDYFADVEKLAYTKVNARRYSAAGTPQSIITVLNSTTVGALVNAVDVAMDPQGDFVVGYQLGLYRLDAEPDYPNSFYQVDTGDEVWVRRYTAAGVAANAQRAIATTAPTFVNGFGVDMDNSGGVTVAWATASDNSAAALKALRFDSSSQPDGASFDLASTAAGALANPAVALLPNGNIVFGFEAGTTSDSNVFIRRFEPSKANLSASFGDVKVGKPPASAFASTLIPGDVVSVTVRINNGPTSALAVNTTTNIALFASSDHAFGGDILLGTLTNQKLTLAIGAAASYTFTWTVGTNTPPGAYRLYAVADSANTTLEVTEDDNVADAGNDVNVGWSFGNIGGGRKATLVLNDADGTKITYSLKGNGSGALDADGNLVLTGTDIKTAVTVAAVKSKTPGDNGTSNLGNVTVNGSLASLTAKTTNLTGDFSVTGGLAALTLKNAGVSGTPHTLTITDNGNVDKPLTLTVVDANNLGITSNAPIGKITANSWGGNSPWNIASTVGIVSIKGVASMSLLSTGDIKSITVGQLFNARIFAGVDANLTTLPASLASFTGNNTLGSLTVKGIKGQSFAFINSLVAARTITKITLKQVKLDSGPGPITIGVAADTLKTYKRDKTALKNITAASDNDVNLTYRVQVV